MALRVLMILTSNDRMGENGKPTGLWAEELAAPYYAFVDAGLDVTLASPCGGVAPIDPGSVQPVGQNAPIVERLLADEAMQARLRALTPVAHCDGAAFDAVFFPGGHGTMWDLPNDAGVTAAVERAFAQGRWISAVCHGVAGLVTARRPDGAPIVQGLKVNAFTDAEERAVGLQDTVPFLLESRLRSLGADFVGAEPWQSFAVQDGPLITGQNPQSSEQVAQALLSALGVTAGH